MNEAIDVRPGDGPLTVYVVAVLFERRVSPCGRQGVGFGGESVLLQVQLSEPGERTLSDADAIQGGIVRMRETWASVMGATSSPHHFAVTRGNVNTTVIRPAGKKKAA